MNTFWFGNSVIYIKSVEDITATCVSAVEDAGYRAKELDDEVDAYLRDVDMLIFLDNPTHTIIDALLTSTYYLLTKRFVELGIKAEVGYFTNGDDSHLYVNNEEYFDGESIITELIAKAKDEFDNKLILAMTTAGYYYDDINSNDSYYRFNSEYSSIEFANPKEIKEWLDGVVFDDPEISLEVEKIMHPENFN